MKNAYEIREEHVAIILKHKGEVLEALVDIIEAKIRQKVLRG